MATFKTQPEIEAELLADFKSITGIDLSPDDVSREEVIKIKTYSGALSHFYARLQRVEDDFYPESASTEGLIKHLAAKGLQTQIAAQPSSGTIRLTGTAGTVIPAGTQVKYSLNGAVYVSQASATLDGTGQALVLFKSLSAGQAYNIAQLSQSFSLVTPIVNVDNACTNTTQFTNGRDLETPAEMLARIQEHDRNDDTGGNLVAYERFAKAASPLVVTATPQKNPRGPGTVNTVITSGTTDIEGAVRAGVPVTRLPSSDLLAAVQAYIIAENPTTDDHQTVGPTEAPFDVTVTYALYDETLRDTTDVEIQKVAKIYIYEAVPAQVLNPTDLERRIDQSIGHLISFRRVSNFGGASPRYTVPGSTILVPGTITLASG